MFVSFHATSLNRSFNTICIISQASLYSVRWYFESEEFYRYVPKEAPPARTFPVSGINVDVNIKKEKKIGFYNNKKKHN
jgi:hypothetical protein